MILKSIFPNCRQGALALCVALAVAMPVLAKEKKGGLKKTADPVVLPKEEPTEADMVTPKISVSQTAAKLDELVEQKLTEQKLKPNELVGDEVFLRRVYLDVIGRVPTKKEALAFLDSPDPKKRVKLINQLLASDGYVDHMFNFWADLLRVKTLITNNGQAAGHAYIDWIKDSVRHNKHYDQMVRELLTADGPSYTNGAVGYYMRDYNMPLDNMAVTTQIFLGTQMVCAQCHNHPFDKWTQKDYYELAAHSFGMAASNVFFNQAEVSRTLTHSVPDVAERKDIQKAFTEILFQLRFNHIYAYNRDLKLPHDYKYPDGKPNENIEPVIPASFSKDGKVVKDGEHPIVAYARWMTSPDNPRFTLVIANRLWKKLMGVGVIDPVDEITDSTVPSNAPLMEILEQTMKNVNYDTKAFLRVVLNSKTYQRAASTTDLEPGAPYYFAGPVLRRMTAEQIWDSMVALAKDSPDVSNRATKLESDQILTKVEWMDRTLNNETPEEIIEGAKVVAAYQKELSEKVKGGGDVKALAKNQRKMIFQKVDEVLYNNGFEKFAKEVSEGNRQLADKTDAEFAKEVTEAVKHFGRVPTMDEALDYTMGKRREAYQAWMKSNSDKEMKALKIGSDAEKVKNYKKFTDYRETYLVRSADLRNPAPNGHFLRQFGQSDRELVDNANHDASVMQSLTMLNGALFRNLVSPFSTISRAVRESKSPDEIIDTIYLSTMSRHATEEEKQTLRPMLANLPTGRGDVLWTILNTRQFLFIQ